MRQPRSRKDADQFGREVEEELRRGGTLKAAMATVYRRAPGRWRSRTRMFELWAQYRRNEEYRRVEKERYQQALQETAAAFDRLSPLQQALQQARLAALLAVSRGGAPVPTWRVLWCTAAIAWRRWRKG
jgi:hypothetical protein